MLVACIVHIRFGKGEYRVLRGYTGHGWGYRISPQCFSYDSVKEW
jgi:hypothetical protein